MVDSEFEYEYESEGSDDPDIQVSGDPSHQAGAIHWCAATFEEFACRFWIENRLWHTTNGHGTGALEPAFQKYLDHYAQPECSRGTGI